MNRTSFVATEMIGTTWGRLTVLERAPNIGPRAAWRCRCSCGNETTARGTSLRTGHKKSCGCLITEWNRSPENAARLAEIGRRPEVRQLRAEKGRRADLTHLAEWARSPENTARMAELGRREKVGPANPGWTGDDATYRGAHQRTVRTRGLATEHVCQDCTEPAAEWSYTEAPGEWSPDPAHYVPRCKSCHKRHDNLLRYLLGETG